MDHHSRPEGEGKVDYRVYTQGCQHAIVDSAGSNYIAVSCNSPLNPNVGSCPQPMGGGAGHFCLSDSSRQCQYSRSVPPTVKSNAFQRR